MEGLIPYLYKAIVQHKEAQHGTTESWLYGSSPSASYTRLSSGDSGRFQPVSDVNVVSSSSSRTSSTSQVIISSETRSPSQCLTSRRGINVLDPRAILMH
uniref:Legume-specific protein n=1 Tax=Chenopodium quinoa TaxID=63459 RepID=A0A803ME26_CHEQI